ncbi:MAG TPA: hypothetical protein EYO61_06215 [Campylobacterales bacterium]|nr:hypothetical protein [Campylobacterales bacterium]HIO71450.1 hypothetical protein [Campylobacterales bacterium]
MKKIDRDTILFALIDDMASTSSIPKEFNQLISSQNLNCSYTPLNVGEDFFRFTIQGLRNSQIRGVNLGKKYQRMAIDLVDTLSSEAEICRFITSIKVENGKLHGYITIGEAMASLIDGKVAIFGVSQDIETAKSLLQHLNISNLTIIERDIEKIAPILELYPDVNIKFGDDNHYFDIDGYTNIVDFSDGEMVFTEPKDIPILTPNSKEVKENQYRIDIQTWLG